jgi:Glycosyl hydrolase catalytic core
MWLYPTRQLARFQSSPNNAYFVCELKPRTINLVLILLSMWLSANRSAAQVKPEFFGMHVNKLTSMPIDLPIGSLRLWDTGTNWFQLCPSSDYSQCNWQHLDDWLAAAKNNGVSDVAYTFGKVPEWASSEPHGDCGKARPGLCYPPKDLGQDGGGTDLAFRQFVTALVEHNRRVDVRTHAKIRYWGICNEPTAKFFWRGSTAQLVRMAKDAWEIIKRADPQALILTPEPAANSRRNAVDAALTFFDDYLAKGGGKYADVIAFHVYANAVGDHPVPEDVGSIVRRIKGTVGKYSDASGKPLWITECSWGRSEDTNWSSDQDASAFLIRFVVLSAAEDIERIYWYGWDVPTGTLWSGGHPLAAAGAYKLVHDWLLGKSIRCQSNSHLWNCELSGAHYRGKIVWYDEYGKDASYDAKGFTTYRGATGETKVIDPKRPVLRVGNNPVLLEETSPR